MNPVTSSVTNNAQCRLPGTDLRSRLRDAEAGDQIETVRPGVASRSLRVLETPLRGLGRQVMKRTGAVPQNEMSRMVASGGNIPALLGTHIGVAVLAGAACLCAIGFGIAAICYNSQHWSVVSGILDLAVIVPLTALAFVGAALAMAQAGVAADVAQVPAT